jgi:hypothetical protein
MSFVISDLFEFFEKIGKGYIDVFKTDENDFGKEPGKVRLVVSPVLENLGKETKTEMKSFKNFHEIKKLGDIQIIFSDGEQSEDINNGVKETPEKKEESKEVFPITVSEEKKAESEKPVEKNDSSIQINPDDNKSVIENSSNLKIEPNPPSLGEINIETIFPQNNVNDDFIRKLDFKVSRSYHFYHMYKEHLRHCKVSKISKNEYLIEIERIDDKFIPPELRTINENGNWGYKGPEDNVINKSEELKIDSLEDNENSYVSKNINSVSISSLGRGVLAALSAIFQSLFIWGVDARLFEKLQNSWSSKKETPDTWWHPTI